MKKKMLLIPLALLLVMSLVAAGCPDPPPPVQDEPPEMQTGPQVGKLAPAFTLPAIDGQDISLHNLRGKAVLLNFWATWCPSCRAEKPHLIAAYNDFADRGVVMLGVNIGESPSLVREYVIQKGIPFPVLLDTETQVASLYQVRGIPTTFLIDGQGVIREVRIGAFRNAADVAASLGKIIEMQPARL
ncbi:MAG: Thiol-disulfide oxidoreductase ResA [Chloroflexi bacterium]|nr:Thiol-disulfide oxidoreductase ResA [Chloroflexota bacterium]